MLTAPQIEGWTPAIVMQHPDALGLLENNPRKHPERQIALIAAGIARHGFVDALLVDEENRVVSGEARLMAARSLRLDAVPTIRLALMSDADKRLLRLSLNQTATLAGWDETLLADELRFLSAVPDLPLDIAGFDTGEIDALLSLEELAEKAERLPEPPAVAVSRLGDLWHIGRHRIICGDARSPEIYALLMGGSKAAMAFTDPPYNLPIDGHVSGLGKVRHKEFVMASGEMNPEQFTALLRDAFTQMAVHSQDGAIHYICMDWKHIRELMAAADPVYSELKNLIIWNKTNAGMGSYYRSQHELIFPYKVGKAAHINNFGLGSRRYRTNVWTYAGANSFRKGRMEDLAAHPTVKPVDMIMDAIRDCSRRRDIILDSFAGSGSTLAAAHRTGRIGHGIELDPAYVDLIVQRLEQETGETATLLTGETFLEVRAIRHALGEAA